MWRLPPSMRGMNLSAVVRKEGELYMAWSPDLDIASQGDSQEEALANLKEAIELYLEDPDALRPDAGAFITTIEVADDKAPVGA